MSRPLLLAVRFAHNCPPEQTTDGCTIEFKMDIGQRELSENTILANLYEQSKKEFMAGWKAAEEHYGIKPGP